MPRGLTALLGRAGVFGAAAGTFPIGGLIVVLIGRPGLFGVLIRHRARRRLAAECLLGVASTFIHVATRLPGSTTPNQGDKPLTKASLTARRCIGRGLGHDCLARPSTSPRRRRTWNHSQPCTTSALRTWLCAASSSASTPTFWPF